MATATALATGVVHRVPGDLREALTSAPEIRDAWNDLTPLARNEWICWVISAKRESTRKRRIEVGIDKMRGCTRRPCCWPGCPHR